MKKIITSLLLVVAMAWPAQAFAFGFDWGVTGGYNLTRLKLNRDTRQNFSASNRAGWFLGAKANLSIAMGFGLDASLLYSQQKYALDGREFDRTKTMRSVAIPVNARYNVGLGKIASVFIATGPQFDFNVGSRNWNIASEQYTGTDGLFKQENMSTSWNVGAGIKLLSRVEVGVGYNFGLGKVGNTILTNATGHDYHTNSARANTFKVSMAVYF